jgi:hypothetical protein
MPHLLVMASGTVRDPDVLAALAPAPRCGWDHGSFSGEHGRLRAFLAGAGFWDWALWLRSKLARRDDVAAAELRELHQHLLGPMGTARAGQPGRSGRRVPLGPGEWERRLGTHVSRNAENTVIPILEGQPLCPGFLLPSGIRFSVTVFPPGELGLVHGRLTGHHLAPGPGWGFHVSHLRDTTAPDTSPAAMKKQLTGPISRLCRVPAFRALWIRVIRARPPGTFVLAVIRAD